MSDKFQDTFSPVPSFVAGEQPKATKYSRWAAQTDNALAQLEAAVGNMWASTIIENDIRPMLFTSLARAVGNMEWVNPYIPADVDVLNHEEFTPTAGRELVMDLFPQDTAYPTGTWMVYSNDTAIIPGQYQTTRADLAANGDWTHVGRRIYTYAALGTVIIGGSDRIIRYHGETREGDLGMGFGIFPNLSQIQAAENTGCTVTQKIDGFGETYYWLDTPYLIASKQLPGETSIEDPPVGVGTVQLELPDQLVLTTGEEIPAYLAMLWDVGDDRDIPNMGPVSANARYWAESSTRIKITNVTLDGFASDADGEINNTRYVLVTMGQSLAEAFGQMWKRYLNHTHGPDSFGASLSHTNLVDTVSLQLDINNNPLAWVKGYATQPIIFNNNHPQYLYREGYQNDPGTYYNSMVGDLNLASEDENIAGDGSTDYHQNFDWDTVKLMFYGPTGPSIFYSTPRGGSVSGQLERLVFRSFSIDGNANPDTLTLFDGGFQFGHLSDISGAQGLVGSYFKLQAEFLGPVDFLNYLRVRQRTLGPAPIIHFDASCDSFLVECDTTISGDLSITGDTDITGDLDVLGQVEFYLSDIGGNMFLILDVDNANDEAFRFEGGRALFSRSVEVDDTDGDVTFDGVDLSEHSHREGFSEGGRVPVEGIDRVGDRGAGYTPVRINSAGYAVYAP